jgi:hypothetical protein
MRVPYYCPYCNQRSTRRWNLDVHIKRRHGGYLLGESSGRRMGSNPFWHTPNNPYRNIGSATVANSIGDTFQPRHIPQQAPIGTSPSTIHPPLHTMDDQRNGPGLSQGTILKIEQLRRLLNKYPQYQNNDPDEIVRLVVFYCMNGDYTLLDDKLEQLRTIDSLANIPSYLQ